MAVAKAKPTKSNKKPVEKKNLVIVESPAKAKTLKKFLGSQYKIEASMGHVRDLPKSELGIDTENDFEPKYITIRGKGDLLAKLRKEAKDASKVYLATDPDREGEAISWHLMTALKLNEANTERITFNEITKTAVKKSIKEARPICMSLVDAQQARRALDRVVGYKMSPILWKKIKKGLSAGRVQSVTLRIICDREEEIDHFQPEEYWSLDVLLEKKFNKKGKKAEETNKAFTAKYYGKENQKFELTSKEQTDAVLQDIANKPFVVLDIKKGSRVKKPSPPFTTSTLQQEASKTLGYATNKTMLVAQQLYEGVDIKGEGTMGIVSYIRTDSVRISDEAFAEAKTYIEAHFGEAYALQNKPEYKTRARTQDAHEAIRPTNISLTPQMIKESLTKEQFKLYQLIWDRFTASNMSAAVFDTVSSSIGVDKHLFRASGSVLRFEGYKAIFRKEDDDEGGGLTNMPELLEGEELVLLEPKADQHFTQPPPRYTDAMLVKTLEENGVGRPSTYAPTITTIVSRGYVTRENKVFFPTQLGSIVNEMIVTHFRDIINIDFTAKMEEDLDRVEDGEMNWKEVLREFYEPFQEKVKQAEDLIGEVEIKDEETDVICEQCGKNMVIKFGKFGKFLACPGFPECKNAKPFFEETGVDCPVCGGKVLVKKTKKGRVYYGCEHGPECSFMSWNKPNGQKCPVCGEFLVEKGTQKTKIACSNNECNYSATKPETDENQEKRQETK